jgi:hypothetical protein
MSLLSAASLLPILQPPTAACGSTGRWRGKLLSPLGHGFEVSGTVHFLGQCTLQKICKYLLPAKAQSVECIRMNEYVQSFEEDAGTGVLTCAARGLSSPLPGPPSLAFPRCPGETPRAFGAFQAFFALGQGRSLRTVAGQLGENPATVKNWSCKYRWSQRIQSFNSGLLQQQAAFQAAWASQQAADWARRDADHREQEWAASQKLLTAVDCFLESFGDREVEKMNLAQVSRALEVSSRLARQALQGAARPEEPAVAPLQAELAAAIARAYGPAPAQTPTGAPRNPEPPTQTQEA